MDYNKLSNEELEKRIDKINKKVNILLIEESELSEIYERRLYGDILNKNLLNLTRWNLQITEKGGNYISFRADTREAYTPVELFQFAKGDHDHIKFKTDCELSFSDGEVFLIFRTDYQNVLEYIKDWNLKIKTDSLEEMVLWKQTQINCQLDIINKLKIIG